MISMLRILIFLCLSTLYTCFVPHPASTPVASRNVLLNACSPLNSDCSGRQRISSGRQDAPVVALPLSQTRRDVITAASLVAQGFAFLLVATPAHAKNGRAREQIPTPSRSFVPGLNIPLEPVLGTCCPCPVDGSAEFADEASDDVPGLCKETYKQVSLGIACGFRWIDTATHYNNEKSVGMAIQDAEQRGVVKKGEVKAITKVWFDDMGYKRTLASCEASLSRLGVSCLDAALVHFPGSIDSVQSPAKNKKLRAETWKALEDLKKQGKVKYIGISNYVRKHLKELLSSCEIRPDIAELEVHPFFQQSELVAQCRENGIQVVAFSPLANGVLGVLKDKTIAGIAAKHSRTPAQVVLKWLIQDGVVPVVRVSTEERMREDLDVAGLELDAEDLAAIRALERSKRVGFDPNQIA